jgi:hypothetical protein
MPALFPQGREEGAGGAAYVQDRRGYAVPSRFPDGGIILYIVKKTRVFQGQFLEAQKRRLVGPFVGEVVRPVSLAIAALHGGGDRLGVYLHKAATGTADVGEVPAGNVFYKAGAAAEGAGNEPFFLGRRRSGPGFNQSGA